jgi:hypothetical protein
MGWIICCGDPTEKNPLQFSKTAIIPKLGIHFLCMMSCTDWFLAGHHSSNERPIGGMNNSAIKLFGGHPVSVKKL